MNYEKFRACYDDPETAAKQAFKMCEGLVIGIRNAKSLSEVLRLVGPSDEEVDEANRRVRMLEALWEESVDENWGTFSKWPKDVQQKYKAIQKKQHQYTEKYF